VKIQDEMCNENRQYNYANAHIPLTLSTVGRPTRVKQKDCWHDVIPRYHV